MFTVCLHEHCAVPAVPCHRIDKQVAETNLDRRMNVNFRLLDEGKTRASERCNHHWNDLRDAGTDLRRKHKRVRPSVEKQASNRSVDVATGQFLGRRRGVNSR